MICPTCKSNRELQRVFVEGEYVLKCMSCDYSIFEETVEGLQARVKTLEKDLESMSDHAGYLLSELCVADRLLVNAGVVADDEKGEQVLRFIPRVKLAIERLKYAEDRIRVPVKTASGCSQCGGVSYSASCPKCGPTEVNLSDIRESLISFFYELARDHVTIGVLNAVLSTSVDMTARYSDKALETWAKTFVHYFIIGTPPEWVEKLHRLDRAGKGARKG